MIGTKLDIVQENPEMRQVTTEAAKAYADSVNAVLFETSARSNINVDNVFNYIGTKMFPGSSPLIPSENLSAAHAHTGAPANRSKNDRQRSEESCCCVQ